jgi:two-component system NtrC family sensor kinase
LVDDERNVLRSLERIFLDENYEILTAPSDGGELGEYPPSEMVIPD